MKHYVITIEDNPKSVKAAERCIKSGYQHGGIQVHKWKATTPADDIQSMIKNFGINMTAMNEIYSRTPNCMAAFLSHFSLWKESVDTNQEITIFEHDAVCVQNIPTVIKYNGCVSLGAPSYGKFNTPTSFGVVPLQSKRYFPGAHAYRVNPGGASILIQQAIMQARPTDVFLNIDTFPFLQEFYPWPVMAKDTFTTIQKSEGCQAKHNYNANYEIIDV